jgi:tRNA nucleotidyltransferase (CCA-adding enzyme)
MQKLGAKGVGKSFFVYKYDNIDISLPRTESKVAKGHRGFDVSLATNTLSAAKRRDFTVNALMYDIKNETIIDHFGGLNDLKHKILKIVDKQTFVDDSLRVLRAMQFSARLGFKIDKNSAVLMRQMDLSDLSDARIFSEFEKMFYAKNLHYGLYAMLTLDIAQKLFCRTMNFKTFLKTAKLLRKNFAGHLYAFAFIYQLKRYFDFTKLTALPKCYTMALAQPNVPSKITNRYVLAVALRWEIKNFLGNYDKKVIQYAKELSVWDAKFQAVQPAEVIKLGYKNGEISKKIKQENLKAIRNLRRT